MSSKVETARAESGGVAAELLDLDRSNVAAIIILLLMLALALL